jgi:hypothetical protein
MVSYTKPSAFGARYGLSDAQVRPLSGIDALTDALVAESTEHTTNFGQLLFRVGCVSGVARLLCECNVALRVCLP